MKYVSKKYEKQLDDLAELLLPSKLGQLSLVGFEPTPEPAPESFIPPTLRLLDPAEKGWEYVPPTEAA